MADHLRLQILKALTTHLEGIYPDNDEEYTHDLRGRVFRGRNRFGAQEGRTAMLSLLEAKSVEFGNFADEEKSYRKDTWVILLQGWAEDDAQNPTDPVYALLGDVERRLSDIVAVQEGSNAPKWPGVYNLGGLIAGMALSQPIVRPPEDGLSDRAFFYMPVQITLASNIKQPKG